TIVPDLGRPASRRRLDHDVIVEIIVLIILGIGIALIISLINIKGRLIDVTRTRRCKPGLDPFATGTASRRCEVEIVFVVILAALERKGAEIQLATQESLAGQPPMGDGTECSEDTATLIFLVVINLHLLLFVANNLSGLRLLRGRSFLHISAAKHGASEGEQPECRQGKHTG